MYDQRLIGEVNKSFGKKENWIGIPIAILIAFVTIQLWLFWDAHTPPYPVRLNPETDYGGVVYLYNNMNPMSATYIKIPVEYICTRIDGEIYTQEFDPPLDFYKVNCGGANGYIRTNKVILP